MTARAGDSATAQAALAKLCQTYWYPLYAFIRRRGHSAHEAEDLTQEFFARLLDKNFLQSADRERGRFRTFLLAAMEHFLANEWNRGHRLKRGGQFTFVSWDAQSAEERYAREPLHDQTPEKMFERRWAVTLLEQVHTRLREEHLGTEKEPWFDGLQPYLTGDSQATPYAEAAARLNTSEGAIRVAVHRLRQRFGELLRTNIADTVASEAEVDEELRHLIAILRGG